LADALIPDSTTLDEDAAYSPPPAPLVAVFRTSNDPVSVTILLFRAASPPPETAELPLIVRPDVLTTVEALVAYTPPP
jgi:hypothetical protein